MLLRLPLLLRRAVLGCMSTFLAVSSSAAALNNGETIVFCGDSITQGAGGGIGPGYRYQVFKNFVDNGLTYNALGSMNTAGGGEGSTPSYGGAEFDRDNEGHSGWWAQDLTGDKGNHAYIENWTGQSNTQAGGGAYTGPTYNPDNVFILAGTNDILHMNNSTAPSTDVMVARILKCADQYKAANPQANVYISALLPQEKNGFNSWTPADYNKRTREVNEALKKMAKEKGYIFVQTDEGIRGQSDAPISGTDTIFTGDNLHPNAQGELIMAGNIARALGIGQRNAGLTRKSGASLANKLSMSSVPTTGMNGKAWTRDSGANAFLVKANGASYFEQSWTGSNLSNGYTCDLSLQMFSSIGKNQFSLQLGNGTTSGLLNIGQDRVAWGTTVLFVGLNTNTVSDYRVVYNPGDTGKGINAGYYVWRNGVLIGEALAGATGSLNGVQAGSLTGGSANGALTGLAWDTTGAFAPNYTGVAGADAKGTERLSGFASLKNMSWQEEWPTGAPTEINGKAAINDVKEAINALTGSLRNAKITSDFSGPSNGYALMSANEAVADIYIDLAKTWINTDTGDLNFSNLMSGGTHTGNILFKFSEGGRITNGTAAEPGTIYKGAFIGSNNTAYTGNLYLEFDSSVLKIEGRTLVGGAPAAVTAVWGTNNLMGSVKMVFKKGVFGFEGNTGNQGMIVAGVYNNGAAGYIGQSTFIEIAGGTFHGPIIGGGCQGSVAVSAPGHGTNILIKGGTISGNIYGGSATSGNVGTSALANGTNIRIDGGSNPLAISGSIYGASRDGGIVYGDTNITLSNFDQAKLASFAAGTTFNGGAKGAGTVSGAKVLTFDKVTGDIANALNNFDRIVVKEGTVGLTHADSAKALKDAEFSGAGSLALKVAGTYQFKLGHTGNAGNVDASMNGIISNIVVGKAKFADAISMNTLKLGTGSLTFDMGRGLASGNFDTLALASMTSTGKIDIVLNFLDITVLSGDYELITGDLSGVQEFALTPPALTGNKGASLVRENNKLILRVTGDDPKNIKWNGGAAGTWQNGGGSPWDDGGGSSSFTTGDLVTFTTMTGVTDSVITLVGSLTPGSITVSGETNYKWQGTGSIAGAGDLAKSGTGTLMIATNNVDYTGKIELKGGVLEIGHANALGRGSLVFNGGTLKYGTGITKDISSLLGAATTGNDNTVRVDTNGNDVQWEGTLRGSYAYIKSGDGTLTLKATGAGTYSQGIAINAGSLGFNTSAGNATVSGQLTGKGNIIKTGGNNLFLTSNSNDFEGVLDIRGGNVVVGAAATSGGGALAKLGAKSTIIIGNGASFRTHLGAATGTPAVFDFANAYVKSGGSIGNIDGFLSWSGNIAFNVDTIGADGAVTYNANGTSTMYQFYGKRVVVNGIVSGVGTVKWETGTENGSIFAFTNTGNTFSGTYNLDTAHTSVIELATADTASGGVLSKASVVLKSANSSMRLSGNAGDTFSLVNLDSSTGTSITSSSGAKTLVINDTKDNLIAGSVGDAANAVTLIKKGNSKLTLAGTMVSQTIVKSEAGVLQLGNGPTYATDAQITVGSASSLNVGGIGVVTTLTVSKLTLDAGSHLIMDVGPAATGDKIVYTGTTALAGAHVLDITAMGITAAGEYILIDSTTNFDASFSVGVWAPSARGMQGSFVLTDKQLKLNITAVGAAGTIVWGGTTASNTWEVTGASTNWMGGAAGDNHFYQADNVQFTAAAANKVVTIKGQVTPASISVTADGYSFEGTGSIAGSAALTMNAAAGTLKIKTANKDWSGNIQLTAGTIEFGLNGLGTGAVTMDNGTMLTWAVGNTKTVGSLTASGELVKLNSGANIITGTQVVGGTYTTLEKLGTGSIDLSLSGSSTLRITEGSVNVVGTSINNAYYIGRGATLNVKARVDTGDQNAVGASVNLAGGTLNIGAISDTYFGGRDIRFTGKSSIISDEGTYWRMEGNGPTTGVVFTVDALGSGSTISVSDLRFTRAGHAVVFDVANGAEAMDLSVSSKITAHSGGSSNERLQKKGEGTMLFTGTEGGVSLLLDAGKFQIGNAKNGNTAGAWSGAITIAAGAELAIDKTDDLALGGASSVIAGAGTINIMNKGKVTLSSGTHTFTGKMILAGGGTLDMAGSAMGAGSTLDIYSGNLNNAAAFVGNISIDQTKAPAPSSIDLGGALGNRLTSFKGSVDVAGDKATQVKNIGDGNITLAAGTKVELGITSGMVSSTAGTGDSIFSYATGAGNTVTLNGDLGLKLTDAAATALINGAAAAQYINITNGNLVLGADIKKIFESPYHIFQNMFSFGNVSGGSLQIVAKDAERAGWLIVSSMDTPLVVNSSNIGVLNVSKGIYNDGTITLDVSAGDVTLRNLEGASANGVINTVAGQTVTLSNMGDIASSVYHGAISGGADVIKGGTNYDMSVGRLNLTGGASLTVNGGSLTINNGGAGSESLISGDLVLNNSGRFTLASNHNLTLNGEITTDASATGITLNEKSVLKLATGFELGVGITGKGTLNVLTGNFSIGANGSLGDDLTLAVARAATATMKDGDSVGALTGDGTVDINGGTLELKNASGTFSGTFTGADGTIDHSGSGTQTIVSTGNRTLSIKQSGSGTTRLEYEAGTAEYKDITVDGGTLEIIGSISTNSTSLAGGTHLLVGTGTAESRASFYSTSTTLAAGSQISINGITADTADQTYVHAGAVTHTGDGTTTINLSTRGDWTDDSYTINLMDGTGMDASDYNGLLMGALKNLGYSLSSIINEDGTLKAVIQSSGTNGLLDLANSHNTAQAANSIWYSRLENPAEGGTLREIITALINSGSGNVGDLTTQQATAALASYAGSSVTSLFSAQRDSLYQQVKWIRNRTTQMGVNPDYVNEEMPYFNAWIQGNGGYNRIDQQGDQAGYTLDTWGGTAGVDVDINEKLTVGAAFTASYNKIRTNSYDNANGRDDAYYVNLFARLQSKKWAHTLIVTGGTNDATLNRTVSMGDAIYHTNGSTTGSSVGAFYEGTYDVVLNQRGTTILQPLLNASVYRSQLDGYTETGMGDASMKVDDRDATYGRVGLGARLMGIVGSNVLGRGALGEIRVQIVQDYGDETHTATMAPIGALTGGRMNIRGAEVGRTGAQIGAGISLPVGEKGSIYADVDAEFRSRATVLSGNIGYRINF